MKKKKCPTCKKMVTRTWELFKKVPKVCEHCYLATSQLALVGGGSPPGVKGADRKMYQRLQEKLGPGYIVTPAKDSRSVGGVFVRNQQS